MQFVTNFSPSDLSDQCRELLFFDPTLDTSVNKKTDVLLNNLSSILRDSRAALGFSGTTNPVRGVDSTRTTYYLTQLRYAQGSETYSKLVDIFHNSVAWGKSPFASVLSNYAYDSTAGPTAVLWPSALDTVSSQELTAPSFGIKNTVPLLGILPAITMTYVGWQAFADGTFSTKQTYSKSWPGLSALLSTVTVNPVLTVMNTKKVDYVAAPYSPTVGPSNFVSDSTVAVPGKYTAKLATSRTAEKVTLQFALGYVSSKNIYIRLARGTDFNVAASVDPGTRQSITFLTAQQKVTL
ncbi:hypothetical protein YOLOSWAG_184 [Erwinia phage vB_EamM_Yoloswag]|uniref:Uncharacterized protein n=1 Tax=Erwinia phage vB_EamM_Yoloswag TaxID=1958956 RepID=A0A1S6L3A9_9CAUD|nr:hypothetical protein HOR66_gp184 [Erwinia phage vB_EamM_Yoloswag]AQT28663.1 hypothetical protein YOLOSWAG_184 [Erwinia phage vB_EamM_Yoloswag]